MSEAGRDEPNVPDPLAALDQALRGMADLALMLKAHFDACVDQGLSETQALRLTIGWQSTMARQQDEDA